MKLNENSIINVVDSKDFKQFYIHWNKQCSDKFFKHYDLAVQEFGGENIFDIFTHKEFFYSQSSSRRMIFSKKSLNNLSNYKVPKDIRVEVLKTLPNRKDVIQLDENTIMRYIKTDKMVYVSFNTLGLPKNGLGVYVNFFSVNLETGEILFDNYDYQTEKMLDYNDIKEMYYNKFMVVVTYLELTPITYNFIDGNRSYGTKKEDKIKNETNKRFIMVNTNWNVETISLCDIQVRGHWRLQPYGVGRSQYKYIYIQPFEKGITRRLPQKELV
jgi:hypothetical protein